jgi:hypothetical protein
MSALVNRVFPVDLPAIIGVNSYAPVNLQGIIGGVSSDSATMTAFIALNNQGNIPAQIGAAGGHGNLQAAIPKVWKFQSILASMNVFNNAFGLELNTGSNSEQEYVLGPSFEDVGISPANPDFTISIWFRNVRGDTPVLWESIAAATNGFAWSEGFGFYWSDATTITFWMNEWNVYFVDAPVVEILHWQHLVATFDGTTMSFYLNGVLQGTSFPPALDGNTHEFNLGRANSSGGSSYSRGNFEDVAMWRRALDINEVQEIFNYGLAYPDLSVAGTFYDPSLLRLWWDMDDTIFQGTYPVIADKSSGNHNGTLFNGPVDEDDAITDIIPSRNNVSMDFPDGDCYFRTTTSDNGVPVDGTGSFSVMVVVRNQTTAFAKIVGAWNSAQTGGADAAFQLRKFSSGFGNVVLGGVQNTANTAYQPSFSTFLDTTGTVWYNMILTYNSVTKAVRSNMNGTFIASQTLVGTRKSWSEFTIGAARVSDVIGEFWFAEIDTIAVWDKELSDSEIDDVYNNGATEVNLSVVGPTSNLAAWYRLGEAGDSLTTLQDKSGNGHHMVRIGTASNVIVTDVPN